MQNLWRTTITWKKSLKTWIEQKHEKFSQTFGNPQKYLERDEFLLVLNILKNFVREIRRINIVNFKQQKNSKTIKFRKWFSRKERCPAAAEGQRPNFFPPWGRPSLSRPSFSPLSSTDISRACRTLPDRLIISASDICFKSAWTFYPPTATMPQAAITKPATRPNSRKFFAFDSFVSVVDFWLNLA